MGRQLAAALFVLGLASSGCGSAAPPVELTSQADGRTVELTMNQEVELTLGTIGPGQYGNPTISSPAIRFEGMTFPAVQNPGGPTQVFNFRAVAAGTAVVTIPHDTKPAPFTLTLDCCAQ